jgi:TetR/AcrR family transcriptional repressor of nem operon
MRYTKDHKLRTRRHIVEKSSVSLKTYGAQGIGVADLMKLAGMTHGGFYGHFESREQLVQEAFALGMDQTLETWIERFGRIAQAERYDAIIDDYLSARHRDHPGHGCVLPALAADIARAGPQARRAFAVRLQLMISVIAEALPAGCGAPSRRGAAIAVLAEMTGTIALARACGDDGFSDDILAAGRHALRHRFDRQADGSSRDRSPQRSPKYQNKTD